MSIKEAKQPHDASVTRSARGIMLRGVASKAMAVERYASAVFGLALVLGLVFGLASMALGAKGDYFILGENNLAAALTRLEGDVQGSAMEVVNTDTGDDDTALTLKVQRGEAPMLVNSSEKVPFLNADRLDGFEPSEIKGAKAYATVVPSKIGPGGTAGSLLSLTSGFDFVSRADTGRYCLRAPGLNRRSPAVVSINRDGTANPEATASASVDTTSGGCPELQYEVVTERMILTPGGDLGARKADDVGFVIAVM